MSLQDLRTELDDDPLVRGYSGMDDAAAAVDINDIFYRPAVASIETLRNYFLLERKNSMALMGRLKIVSDSAVGADPLGDTLSLTLEHITAATTMFLIVTPSSVFSLDLNDSRFDQLLNYLAGGSGAKVISPGDKTAIQALSENQQTRANELGLGRVREGTVAQARAL